MNIVTRALARLSICKCGYSVLRDSIPVGREYRLDLDSVRGGFLYQCGQCGAARRVIVVNASDSSRGGMNPLPFGLFDPPALPPVADQQKQLTSTVNKVTPDSIKGGGSAE